MTEENVTSWYYFVGIMTGLVMGLVVGTAELPPEDDQPVVEVQAEEQPERCECGAR